MRKLTEVEDAKALMTEAMEWSVVKWLKEKKWVRKTADRANEALDAVNQEVKDGWGDDLKAAYHESASPTDNSGKTQQASMDPKTTLTAKAIKKADDAAHRARMDAEDTFDEAERQLSTRLAREGCRKALTSWELHETAIRKAEAAIAASKVET